jgi:hypothetical protein
VSNPAAAPKAASQHLIVTDGKRFLITAAMVLGNLVLPFAVHQIPDAGRILLPIFFFTLIGGWRFGAQVGILTALLSPLANHYLTGMPPAAALQDLMLQGALLGALASLVAARRPKASLALLAVVVLAHQALTLIPVAMHSGLHQGLATFKLHLPGLLLLVLGGFAALRLLDRYLPQSPAAHREG